MPGVWSLSPGSCSWSLLFHTVLGKSAYLRKTVTPSGVGAEVHFPFSFALNPLDKVEQKTTVVHPGESGVYTYIYKSYGWQCDYTVHKLALERMLLEM